MRLIFFLSTICISSYHSYMCYVQSEAFLLRLSVSQAVMKKIFSHSIRNQNKIIVTIWLNLKQQKQSLFIIKVFRHNFDLNFIWSIGCCHSCKYSTPIIKNEYTSITEMKHYMTIASLGRILLKFKCYFNGFLNICLYNLFKKSWLKFPNVLGLCSKNNIFFSLIQN